MELKIESKEKAKRIYDRPELVKELLEEAYGKETFRKISFEDLKTFDDLCKSQETTEKDFLEAWQKLASISPLITPRTITYQKMEIMCLGINQGWMPNTLDKNEKKWFPIFDIEVSSSGLAFLYSLCCYDYADASVGFPFCFKSKEQSDYSAKQFIKLWKEFLIRKYS